jgi:hypothetical protein
MLTSLTLFVKYMNKEFPDIYIYHLLDQSIKINCQ